MRTLLILLMALVPTALWAEEKPLETKACYQAFEKYNPKFVVDFANKAKKHILEKGEAGFKDFNQVGPLTFESYPYSPPIVIIRCDQMRVETFFFEKMRPQLQEPGSLKKFVDVNGQHTFVKLCSKLRGSVQAAWEMQKHYWVGCNGPVEMGMLLMKIPGTPYAVESTLPTLKYTIKDFEAALR